MMTIGICFLLALAVTLVAAAPVIKQGIIETEAKQSFKAFENKNYNAKLLAWKVPGSEIKCIKSKKYETKGRYYIAK